MRNTLSFNIWCSWCFHHRYWSWRFVLLSWVHPSM